MYFLVCMLFFPNYPNIACDHSQGLLFFVDCAESSDLMSFMNGLDVSFLTLCPVMYAMHS